MRNHNPLNPFTEWEREAINRAYDEVRLSLPFLCLGVQWDATDLTDLVEHRIIEINDNVVTLTRFGRVFAKNTPKRF